MVDRSEVLHGGRCPDAARATAQPLCDIPELIARQAALAPDAVALRCAGAWLGYAELDQRANRLANWLLDQGLRRGVAVAVCMQRSLDLVVALLGITRAGGVYVPLDPAFPAARLQHMIDESEPLLILIELDGFPDCGAGVREQLLQGPKVVDLARDRARIEVAADRPPAVVITSADGFCVLYTSGSTGLPKGVQLSHGNVASSLQWMQRAYPLGAGDVVVQKTPYGFDVSMYELFWPLLAGATVVLARPEGHKDPAYLAELMCAEKVTACHFVPSMLNAFLEEPGAALCTSIRQVFAAGEALSYPLTQRFYRLLTQAQLVNFYGPTEAGTVTHWACPRTDPRELVPIGHAVDDTVLHVLDDAGDAVAAGEEGELYIGGTQLAAGYLKQPDLSRERFVMHPQLGRLYRTGDRVRSLADGALEYRGRRDFQVKIRGIRIELGEIEARLMQHPGVVEAVASVLEPSPGEQRLVAWVQARGAAPDVAELHAWVKAGLPAPMIPQAFVVMAQLPHNANGKIDRSRLPAPQAQRPALASAYRAPQTELQRRLAAIWESVLGFAGVGLDDRFFELGGSSLMALQVLAQLRAQLGTRVPVTRFFAAPSIAGLAQVLEQGYAQPVAAWLSGAAAPLTDTPAAPQSDTPAAPARAPHGQDIAIVGMSCRVPGAEGVEAFWDLLAKGREGIRDLSEDEMRAAGVSEEQLRDPAYVRRSGTLSEPFGFDAAFFGYSPRDAELTDPQQRVLLEGAWHALEHAGIVPGADGRIGVYAGLAHNNYFDQNLATHEELRLGDSGFQTLLATDKDYAATRIAFKLDLRGPALTLQTACSTTGVALHLACQGIRNGDCDAAIVGGVRINVPHTAGYPHVDGGPQAVDGRVRPFDAAASGMVLTSGMACLVLKGLAQALADGDRVYALLKGSAINNDGADKIAYTAPSQSGQLAVIRAALAAAGVAADSVGYVETHGTGTLLGDPIEVAALNQAYASGERIALGSVKSNIGHLDAAAGAIGVIKAVLALERRQLPPTLHYATPNPECELERTPFFVNTELRDWPADSPRRAAVSSFGFGGTNFHGILEQGPEQASGPSARPWTLLRLSAKTEVALKATAVGLGGYFAAQPQAHLADAGWTLDRGRSRFARRGFVVARNAAEAAERLARQPLQTGTPMSATPSLVFMFPGQGAQHVHMGAELYQSEPVFRAAIDECAAVLRKVLEVDLLAVLYPSAENRASATETLRATQLAQPAIFAVSYATAKLWESWGLRADAMVGHSLGEFVAATLAGVFELEHALRIIAERGRLMQSMPGGGMLAVRLSAEQATPYLRDGVALAGINSPTLIVLSGPHPALAAVDAQLQAAGVGTSALHTSHAFHSSMMEPMVAPFAAVVARYPRRAPRTPFVSTLTGTWVDGATMQEPLYWARQLREAVRFGPAVEELLKTPGRVLLEVGPGQNLSTSARQILKPEHQAVAIASLPHAGVETVSAAEHLLAALGRLFTAGIEADPQRFYAGEQRLKLGLPGYAFTRTRYYVEPAQSLRVAMAANSSSALDSPSTAAAVVVADERPFRSALLKLLARLTGTEFVEAQFDKTFLELGMDSLTLTQVATKLKAEFKVELRFRQLMEELVSIDLLSAFLEQRGTLAGAAPRISASAAFVPAEAPQQSAGAAPAKAFGAGARISKARGDGLSPKQSAALAKLSASYLARTSSSKRYAQSNRQHLADPRTVSGFRPLLKELVYPIVVNRSDGAYLWDLDGNQYVDATCGFGSVFFGHKPKFVADAISEQLAVGWEIGPQTPLAGECAQLFSELTGMPRVAFCNTGSEAVLAAVRLARTVTGKNLVVSFTGDYHGIQDEVIIRPGANLTSIPAAPGIPNESVANTLILDYGAPRSIEIIKERSQDIAAILIEPVQSRRPDFQPREFLLELRAYTEQANIAYIFDEVITGFRAGLGGAQAFYGIQADIGTYGKVFGGGIPVGAIAGIPKYMDALDGGQWSYGDDSVPEVGVTYFAGTFVRHPLTLAAVRACLKALKANPHWQGEVTDRAQRMVDTLNADFHAAGAPMHVARFASLWKPAFDAELAHGDLFFYYLREQGIHIWEGRPCFLTTAHTEADCQKIIAAFRYATEQMLAGEFFGGIAAAQPARRSARSPYTPPLPGARIGRRRDGSPAWFVAHPDQAGRWREVEIEETIAA